MLPVPWEYSLWLHCREAGVLPVDGGLFDQYHILMHCFEIIEAELRSAKEEEKKREEANKRLAEAQK
jgi:hypothetical protein